MKPINALIEQAEQNRELFAAFVRLLREDLGKLSLGARIPPELNPQFIKLVDKMQLATHAIDELKQAMADIR